jgi:hypothetical protein
MNRPTEVREYIAVTPFQTRVNSTARIDRTRESTLHSIRIACGLIFRELAREF